MASDDVQAEALTEHLTGWILFVTFELSRLSSGIMKIVIASDSFKGSLSSAEVAGAVAESIRSVNPSVEVVCASVADGGEGTVDSLLASCGGEKVTITVSDPLLRPIQASYGLLPNGTAMIEMSSASGLPLLAPGERNPVLTSTRGTGELVADALSRGCTRILMGIGGSATNDAGTGMLTALGYRFLDADGNPLPGIGASLGSIVSVDDSAVPDEVRNAEFRIACDVDSPFCGPRGAACVFARQKGADDAMIDTLDRGLSSFAEKIACIGVDVREVPGAGAAGGLGGACLAFLNARLVPGVEMVLDAIGFDALLEGADLVITGEGRMDSQTLAGKTPCGIMKHAVRRGIPVAAICGSCMDRDLLLSAGFASISEVTPEGMPLEEAMEPSVARANVISTVKSILE